MWGNGEVIFDLPQTDESGVSGLVSVIAQSEATRIEVGVVGTTEEAQVGIHMGTCADLEPMPTYDLEPVLTETMSSVTTLDVGFEELTDGRHAIVIQASADVGGATPCLQRDPKEE